MDGMLHPERSNGDCANPRSIVLMQSICAKGRLEEYRRLPGKTGLSHRASQGQRTLSAGDRSARTAVHGHPEKPHRTDGEQLQRDYWHGQHAPHLKRPFWRFAGSSSFVSFWGRSSMGPGRTTHQPGTPTTKPQGSGPMISHLIFVSPEVKGGKSACAAPRASSTFSPGMNRFTVRRIKP